MAVEWREATLNALGRIVTGKTPPSGRPEYFGGDIPFITPTDLDGRRFIATTGRYLTREGVASVGSSYLPAKSVLVSCIGSDMGKAAMSTCESVTNQQINSIIVEGENDPLFVYYNLSARKEEIRIAAGGSAQPILNKSDFGRLEINLPPPEEQRAIARILGALDDKIEMNRRMNETLEAMARALFKSWFVDFDPVRAKAEGRDPDLPKHVADMFQDSFKKSDLGEIPATWAIKTAGDVAKRIAMGPFGSSIKVETFVDHGVPIISGQHLHDFILSDTTHNFITNDHAEKLSNAVVQRGDVIFTHAGNIGQVAFIPDESRYSRYVISQRQFYMRCDPTQVSPLFVTLNFRSEQGRHQLLANTSSSGVPSIARPVSYLRSIPMPVPPTGLLADFERLVCPLIVRLQSNRRQSETLSAIRDALLPKLMSGELRVTTAAEHLAAI